MTSWVPKHPGGKIIGLGAGRESTALVHSYHPTSVLSVLQKYYIGDVIEYLFLTHSLFTDFFLHLLT